MSIALLVSHFMRIHYIYIYIFYTKKLGTYSEVVPDLFLRPLVVWITYFKIMKFPQTI